MKEAISCPACSAPWGFGVKDAPAGVNIYIIGSDFLPEISKDGGSCTCPECSCECALEAGDKCTRLLLWQREASG